MTMTHLPGPAPTDGSPGARNPQGSGHGKGGLRIAGITIRLSGAGLDGGRIVRAVAWARSGDPTRATQLGALHLGQPAR